MVPLLEVKAGRYAKGRRAKDQNNKTKNLGNRSRLHRLQESKKLSPSRRWMLQETRKVHLCFPVGSLIKIKSKQKFLLQIKWKLPFEGSFRSSLYHKVLSETTFTGLVPKIVILKKFNRVRHFGGKWCKKENRTIKSRAQNLFPPLQLHPSSEMRLCEEV